MRFKRFVNDWFLQDRMWIYWVSFSIYIATLLCVLSPFGDKIEAKSYKECCCCSHD